MSDFHPPRRPSQPACRRLGWAAAGLMLVTHLASGAGWETNLPLFGFGVSTRMLKGVNETDARAAVKVYTEALVQEAVFPKVTPVLFDSDVALKRALEKGEVEVLSLTVEEYVSLRDLIQSVHVFNLPNQDPPGEEYVVLVHQSDPAQSLRDLVQI